MSNIDLVLINPAAAHGILGNHPIYGDLGNDLVAIEQPLWCRLIAGYVRDRGYTVQIIDAEALKLSPEMVAHDITRLRPRLVAIASYGHQPSASSQQMVGAGETAKQIKQRWPESKIIMLGGHVSALPERTMREEQIDYACVGEGPLTIEMVLSCLRANDLHVLHPAIDGLVWRDGNQIRRNRSAKLMDLSELHGNVWDLLPMHIYKSHNWQAFGNLKNRYPYASIYTSLGCSYKCLGGDTEINTIYGNIPIKELARKYGKEGIPVYTYDKKRRKVFISDSIHIKKYGTNEKMIRVHFDDGTYIDCTPDHKFLQFKWGNGRGNSKGTEWECEAKDLKSGAHVRAISFEQHPIGYVYVQWGRRDRRHRSRLVMDYLIGRKLKRSEHVHHMNHDKSNDHPSNLLYCRTAKEHFDLHPEISERMRTNNPAKNMTPEWRAKITKSQTGLKRSDEAIKNYQKAAQKRSSDPKYIEKLRMAAAKREAKMKGKCWWTTPTGQSYLRVHAKHPDDVVGRIGFNPRRKETNHRVVRVEKLKKRGDVYCLTVPETGWFFANNVLVKNCSFCCINAPFETNRYRMRNPDDVVKEIVMLYNTYGITTIKITDEMFVLNRKHYTAIAQGLIDSGISDKLNIWSYSRIDTVKPDTLALLRKAGIRWLALGIESGSKYVRDGASKRLKNDDIKTVVRAIQAADINVIGNYIFGLPDDDMDSMRETLNLALDLNTEFANMYVAMAYPGSPLYDEAVKNGWTLPETWRGYSQHNDDCRPLDTRHISAAAVLKFRDEAFSIYFRNPAYQQMVLKKFGQETLDHVKDMTRYELPRKLLQNTFAPKERASAH